MPPSSHKLPSYVYLYFICQAINLLAAVISVTVVASVGEHLATHSTYSTLPYGFQFLLLLLSTYPIAVLMKKKGRQIGFLTGAFCLFLAGIVGYVAVAYNHFMLLMLSHGFIGIFTAAANFYRFAVTDNLSENLKSKALSLVVAGGIIAGVLGPIITIFLRDVAHFPKYSLCYAFFMVLAITNVMLVRKLPAQSADAEAIKPPVAHGEKVTQRPSIQFYLAVLVASISYGLMNLLMVQSSLQMHHSYISFEFSSLAIQWHVLAMFIPSFFTGVLIHKMGHSLVISGSVFLFIFSFLINVIENSYWGMSFSLIILGIAWNLGFVGGSSLLTHTLEHIDNKQKWQGICDTIIAVFATLGAILPSILLSTIGWEKTNMAAIVIAAMPIVLLVIIKVQKKERY